MPTANPQPPIRVSSREDGDSVIFTQHAFGEEPIELMVVNKWVFDTFPGTFPMIQVFCQQLVQTQLKARGFESTVQSGVNGVILPEGGKNGS